MRRIVFQISLVVLLLSSTIASQAYAASGLPNSATFGYGARLDMWGQDVYAAIELASALGLDWLAIDVDWARHWPALDQPADFSTLDYVLQAARQKHISVMLSLKHAPLWALTATGPEPSYTNALLQSILNAYADVIQAVELFPGVNSTLNWGTLPDPQTYLNMLQIIRQGCNANGRSVYLITTLEPLLPGTDDGSLDDRTFLEALYNLGAADYMPIVGIRYPVVMGAPMTDQSDQYPIVLRHYEDIRAMMLQHQHARGMIWISGFSWPTSGTADPSDPLTLPITPSQQAQWVNQAFQLLRAQLFIGTAFYAPLNQPNTSQPTQALVQTDGSIHPASVTISQFAGGSITSTIWAAPQNQASPTLSMATFSTPANAHKFFYFEGKPQK